jgi:hypothetical protein
MRGRLAAALALAVTAAAAGSCTYAPDFGDGTLVCGDTGQCPKGYECASDNTCWKTGKTGGAGGTGGDPRLDSFVGTWDFSTGLISGSCSDGYTVNDTLNSTDFVVIERGGSGLLLKYYCDTGWSISLPAGTTTASARAGETCNFQRTSSGVTTNLVWSVNALTFATGDGQAGTVVGRLSGPFSDSTPNTGTCNLMFSGDLLKE